MKKNLFLPFISSVIFSAFTLLHAESLEKMHNDSSAQSPAKIVERKHIASVTEYVQSNQKGLCVIFDLDNTTLHAVQDEGNNEWFNAYVTHFVAQGFDRLTAISKVLPRLFEAQEKAVVKPVQPEVVTLIKDLQDKGICVIALTARNLELEACTIKQLQSIDIDFSKTAMSTSQTLAFEGFSFPARYSQGIMFCAENAKGKILLHLFEKTQFDAKKVVFIDDKLTCLECVRRELAEKGINDFVGIRYSFLDEKVKNFKLDLVKEGLVDVCTVGNNGMTKKKQGYLEVISGSMFSGKTEELIARLKRAEYAKKQVLTIKLDIDKRYNHMNIVSHEGRERSAFVIADEPVGFEKILDLAHHADVIGIDEIQFFSTTMLDVIDKLVHAGKRVIVAGLDLDFRGQPFGIMPALMARADEVCKLKAICVVCGKDAHHTQRLIDGRPACYNDPVVVMGDNYEARCRNCFVIERRPSLLLMST